MCVPEPVPGAGAITQLALKILGPTADYLGQRLLDSVKAAENIARVMTKAITKLGSRADEPGYVKPKVVKSFLEEAPFAEDEITAEYLSGVLASSRDVDPHDFGAGWISTIGRLSTATLKAHYLIFMALHDKYQGSGLEIGTEAHRMSVIIHLNQLIERVGGGLDFVGMNRVYQELIREDILREAAMGTAESFRERRVVSGRSIPWENFIYLTPTSIGVSLLLAASGNLDVPPNMFLNTSLQGIESDGLPDLLTDVLKPAELPKTAP